MIYFEATKEDLKERFRSLNRAEQFSDEGLEALFEHLEEVSHDIGENIGIDVIELCGQYSEIEIGEIKDQTGYETLDLLKLETSVIMVGESRIIYEGL